MALTLYRIVRSDPPTILDFLSNKAQGRRLPNLTTATVRLWDGLSMYASVERAHRKALRYPELGRYLAELRIEDEAPVTYERTTSSRQHYTLWGKPTDFLQRVVAITTV